MLLNAFQTESLLQGHYSGFDFQNYTANTQQSSFVQFVVLAWPGMRWRKRLARGREVNNIDFEIVSS